MTCSSNKRRHSDEVSARAHAMSAIQTHKNAALLYVYKCPECHGWHLTRNYQPRQAAITEEDPWVENHA